MAKGKKWNILLGKEASVDGVVLTPLTPFNSLTPHRSLLNSTANISVNDVVLTPLTPFNSLTPHQILLNSSSTLLLRPNLVACESVVKDEEETRDADPVRGLERGAILHNTTQPRHHSTTSNRHSQQ